VVRRQTASHLPDPQHGGSGATAAAEKRGAGSRSARDDEAPRFNPAWEHDEVALWLHAVGFPEAGALAAAREVDGVQLLAMEAEAMEQALEMESDSIAHIMALLACAKRSPSSGKTTRCVVCRLGCSALLLLLSGLHRTRVVKRVDCQLLHAFACCNACSHARILGLPAGREATGLSGGEQVRPRPQAALRTLCQTTRWPRSVSPSEPPLGPSS
jgi:hypothetical protein